MTEKRYAKTYFKFIYFFLYSVFLKYIHLQIINNKYFLCTVLGTIYLKNIILVHARMILYDLFLKLSLYV